MATTRAPCSLASWATVAPTGPVAAATTSVSPGFSRAISCRLEYAVNPGMPYTPSAVLNGNPTGSSRRPSARAGSTAWVCQPPGASTSSPVATPSALDCSTSATVWPSITAPTATGAAYEGPSSMRRRMYGSSDSAACSRRKFAARGAPCGREASTMRDVAGESDMAAVSAVASFGKGLPTLRRIDRPFGDRGDLLNSSAGDDRLARPAPQRRIKHLRARRRQCEEILAKPLPKTTDLRNIRLLGSDLAATKHVAE
ncbi:hypothetical protein G6F63_013481 [Rhizopus arrhizus]|nr:hypothetical protein G6F63_013481 [Rhizopus arrhizus]